MVALLDTHFCNCKGFAVGCKADVLTCPYVTVSKQVNIDRKPEATSTSYTEVVNSGQ